MAVLELDRELVEAYLRTFPPIRLALQARDAICFVVRGLIGLIWLLVTTIVRLTYDGLKTVCRCFTNQLPQGSRYKRLDPVSNERNQQLPIPYRDNSRKRILTYQVGLLLGLALYIFIYFALIKHHSLVTIGAASLILLVYLVILENSHNMRSILMLSLPIMFTNRGRAFIYCCMFSITLSGPIRNGQFNVAELHSSLDCCKQHLIIKADQSVDSQVIRLQDVVDKVVRDVKEFTEDLRRKFDTVIQLSLTVELYLKRAMELFLDMINKCNSYSMDVHKNCINVFESAYKDCLDKVGSKLGFICDLVKPVKETCDITRIPQTLCQIPREIARYIGLTIGEQLRIVRQRIMNELYIDVDIQHDYVLNETRSKSFKRASKEFKYDVEQKFWYVSLVSRVFNFISLVLVTWIIATATLYHMNFLTNIKYDNMYISKKLYQIDRRRARKKSEAMDDIEAQKDETLLMRFDEDDDDDVDKTQVIDKRVRKLSLFPLTRSQEKNYLRPFSFRMNDQEKSKLCIASLVWVVIMGYVFFFVVLDYSLFSLIETGNELLEDSVFKSDLPIVNLESNYGDRIVRYNRTYLKQLRDAKLSRSSTNSTSTLNLRGMYRGLMDKIIARIPDEIALLDSLEGCLPRPQRPNINGYKHLVRLALLTWIMVLIEAYALRTRHCIANLYFPTHGRRRAVWLYRKMLNEKPKYESLDKLESKKSKRQSKNNSLLEGVINLLRLRNKGTR